MPEHDPTKERAALEEEARRLSGGNPRLMKMERAGEEFYFDTTDLGEHLQDFVEQRLQGWQVDSKGVSLPAFLPARQQTIKKEGLEPFDWGYKKVNSLP